MWTVEAKNEIKIARSRNIEKSSLVVEEAFSQLEELISEHPECDWLVDLHGVSTVSSIAVARLIAIVRRVNINSGNIAMINVHSFVSSVLTTMRIVKVLSLFTEEAEAMTFLLQKRQQATR